MQAPSASSAMLYGLSWWVTVLDLALEEAISALHA